MNLFSIFQKDRSLVELLCLMQGIKLSSFHIIGNCHKILLDLYPSIPKTHLYFCLISLPTVFCLGLPLRSCWPVSFLFSRPLLFLFSLLFPRVSAQLASLVLKWCPETHHIIREVFPDIPSKIAFSSSYS